jgi:hypothetical protein
MEVLSPGVIYSIVSYREGEVLAESKSGELMAESQSR